MISLFTILFSLLPLHGLLLDLPCLVILVSYHHFFAISMWDSPRVSNGTKHLMSEVMVWRETRFLSPNPSFGSTIRLRLNLGCWGLVNGRSLPLSSLPLLVPSHSVFASPSDYEWRPCGASGEGGRYEQSSDHDGSLGCTTETRKGRCWCPIR